MADISLITEAGAIDLSRPCASDLSAKQYYAVKHDTSEKVVIAGANDKALGILQNAPDGSSVETSAIVRVGGISKAILAEAVTFGQYLTVTSTGALEVADAANEEIVARALTSGDASDLIAVQLMFGKDTNGNA